MIEDDDKNIHVNRYRKVNKAVKHDGGKTRMSLLPYTFTKAVSDVMTFGAEKYAAWNWAKGMSWSRVLDAAYRHMGAWQEGEDVDPESGLSHLAHASCCLAFLIVYQAKEIGADDRHTYEY